MFSAFELELSFAILRCQDGLDLSDHFAPEKELGNEEKLQGAQEKGGKEEEEEEGEDSSKKSKPSIWMVSTQVALLMPLHNVQCFTCFQSFSFLVIVDSDIETVSTRLK